MDFRAGTRGQSIQIGAILLFGILVLFGAGYQAFAVPSQNAGIEQRHSELVQDQMQEVRTGIHVTAATGASPPSSVRMAVRYPRRTFFLNPTPKAGTLETETAGDFEISGATAIDGETADFWNGDARLYSTNNLSYRPNYNLRDDPPTTVYESTVLYNQFDDDSLVESDQRIVQGRDISFVALQGDYQRSTTEVISVEPNPVSAPTRTVAIRGQRDGNGGFENITLKVPVSDPVIGAELEESVIDQSNTVDSRTGYYSSNRTLKVELRGQDASGEPITYRLRLSSVTLGSGTAAPSPAYVTDIEGDDSTIPEGGRQQIVVEVRDRFNAPVAGATVEASVRNVNPGSCGSGEFLSGMSPTTTTSDDGRARFVYQPPDDVSPNTGNTCTVNIMVNVEGMGGVRYRTDTTVFVLNSDGS